MLLRSLTKRYFLGFVKKILFFWVQLFPLLTALSIQDRHQLVYCQRKIAAINAEDDTYDAGYEFVEEAAEVDALESTGEAEFVSKVEALIAGHPEQLWNLINSLERTNKKLGLNLTRTRVLKCCIKVINDSPGSGLVLPEILVGYYQICFLYFVYL